MKRFLHVLVTIPMLFAYCNLEGAELKNRKFAIELATDTNGFPLIKKGYWLDGKKEAFVDKEIKNKSASQWLPAALIPDSLHNDNARWNIWKKRGLSIAEFEKNVGNLKMSWRVELFDQRPFFRMYLRMKNISRKELPVKWFPVWAATWNVLSSKDKYLETWQPLNYQTSIYNLKPQNSFTLYSNVYSSDRHGTDSHVPFWHIKGKQSSLFFSLAWSGGWQADFSENKNGTRFQIKLPPNETQLLLQPGESITGPQLYVFATSTNNEELVRSQWLSAREFAAGLFYRKPDNWSPLVYNHWYSCRFNLSSEYIQNQLRAMRPFNFDVFVIDAGWYNKVGDWRPSTVKFKPGEFEKAFRDVKQAGIRTGIWTCPWLKQVDGDNFNEEFEEPRFYRKFMNAYALDLVGTNFERTSVEHIRNMKNQFPVDWWKYDQELFGKNSRAGKMKNIIALQNALAAVRKTFPALFIESCMSGGRMINEFTDQIAQEHWIKDGGRNGIKHARSNIREALGAARFLAPLKIQRWTNRPDELDEKDSSLLKMYCRSAMIGTWGISADLNNISEKQKAIILKEIEVYKKLEIYKQSMKYQILDPAEDPQVAGIVFYHINTKKAALLLYHWNSDGDCKAEIALKLLKCRKYKITNWDTGEITIEEIGQNIPVFKLDKEQMSAIYFIEATEQLR